MLTADTLKDIGSGQHSNTIFMPHSPGGMTDAASQIRYAFAAAVAWQSQMLNTMPLHMAEWMRKDLFIIG